MLPGNKSLKEPTAGVLAEWLIGWLLCCTHSYAPTESSHSSFLRTARQFFPVCVHIKKFQNVIGILVFSMSPPHLSFTHDYRMINLCLHTSPYIFLLETTSHRHLTNHTYPHACMRAQEHSEQSGTSSSKTLTVCVLEAANAVCVVLNRRIFRVCNEGHQCVVDIWFSHLCRTLFNHKTGYSRSQLLPRVELEGLAAVAAGGGKLIKETHRSKIWV